MKCPMTMNDPTSKPLDCRSDCAWLVESGTTDRAEKVCAVAVLASSWTEPMGFAPVNVIERGA